MKRRRFPPVRDKDRNPLRTAQERYRADPISELIPFAKFLYERRSVRSANAELLRRRRELVGRAQEAQLPKSSVDDIEVLITTLDYISRHASVPGNERRHVRNAASGAAKYGLAETAGEPLASYRRPLMLIASAVVCSNPLSPGFIQPQIHSLLREAVQRTPYIQGSEEKARVYRKLGKFKLRRRWNPMGLWYLFRATIRF